MLSTFYHVTINLSRISRYIYIVIYKIMTKLKINFWCYWWGHLLRIIFQALLPNSVDESAQNVKGRKYVVKHIQVVFYRHNTLEREIYVGSRTQLSSLFFQVHTWQPHNIAFWVTPTGDDMNCLICFWTFQNIV